MTREELIKDEIIIKIDSSSSSNIDKLINVLTANNIEIKAIGKDEYLIKL